MESTNHIVKWVVLNVFLCAASFTTAETNTSVAEIKNALKGYPHAEILFQSTDEVDNYILALGAIDDVRGQSYLERQRRLSGRVQKLTEQLPEDSTAEEAFQFYQQRLQGIAAQTLFRCENRQCGRSNTWANKIFKVMQLYGQDRDQQYAVFFIDGEADLNHYISLYTVRRGNRRVMAQLEWLQTTGEPIIATASANSVIQQLNDGYFSVAGVNFSDPITVDPEQLTAITQALMAKRRLNIRIIGHDYSGDDASTQQSNSQRYAEQFKQLLVENRIGADRLTVAAEGGSAPRYPGQSQPRIELMLE